ncbi:MAG: ABC transporter permease [Candidatus Bathyarchaeota archaeon]|nr:MAG: ABC transporter permease [Candidatus Bathyarchaeota archaeon]
MKRKGKEFREPKKFLCPYGFTLANLKAEMRAIWENNVKEWKIEFTYPLSFIRQSVEPLIFLLPFIVYGLVLIGGRYSDSLMSLVGTGDIVTYIFTGYIIMGFIGTSVWAMGFGIRKEQWYGTFESIYVTPTSRISLVLGMALHSVVHQGISVFFEFLVIYAIFGLALRIEGILPALGILALMMLALCGFGLFVSSLALVLKEGWIISEGLYSVLMILSPVAYPLTVLPSIAQQMSKVFPTAPALIGMRSFLIENYTPEVMGNVFLHLLALDLAWIIFGVMIFYATDVYIRKRGTLGKY